MSDDLLNGPGRPCHCHYCTERAYAVAEGPILERVRARVLTETRFWGRRNRDHSAVLQKATRPGETILGRLAGGLA